MSALGVGLLALAEAGSSYLQLLPSLLLWGIGMGVLTPAVVAAAVRTVPRERAGLASAVNNTARQAGGAIGIAAFGAIAGSAANARGFISGMHLSALLAVGVWLIACAATIALIPARASPSEELAY